MGLKEQLREDVAEAMRSGADNKRNTLRMLLAAIKQAEVDQQRELDDEGVRAILAKQAKQRKESIADATVAGRPDLVSQEESELEIISEYMPKELPVDEVVSIARDVIESVGARGPQDMGRVMGQLMPKLKGRADGRVVSDVVRDLLSGN